MILIYPYIFVKEILPSKRPFIAKLELRATLSLDQNNKYQCFNYSNNVA